MRVATLLVLACSALLRAAAPTAAETAQAIREAVLDPEACYRVRDLNFAREDIKLFFNEGYLIFSKPVHGERLSAVFSADVEGGDGEVLLLPPVRPERQSLAKYTQSPNLDEHFGVALLIFSDHSATELLDSIESGGRGRKAPEMGQALADRWNPVVGNIGDAFAIRLTQDLLSPERFGGGFFAAAVAGRTLGNFDLVYEPRAPDQILAAQLSDRENGSIYDIWARFPARSFRTGRLKPLAPELSVDQVQIEATVHPDLMLDGVTRSTVRIGDHSLRLLPFEISRAMDVTAVRIDGAPVEFLTQESAQGRALHPGENASFLIAAPEVLAAGSIHQLEFEHSGRVITTPGKGVYYVGARSNWYPSVANTFASFDLKFRYPRNLTLVTPGEIIDDATDGDWRITHRKTERIRMAGFNLGEYEKVSSKASGFTVDVYANKNVEPALRPPPRQTILVEAPKPTFRGPSRTEITTITQTPASPDPLARLKIVAGDVSAALQYFSSILGPPPVKNLTVSPIPDTFGQGFPGLIYISTTAYLDPAERPAYARGPRQQLFFNDIIQSHEVAHQWWGNLIGTEGYQDDWMMEALAQYSALMFIEKKKGSRIIDDVLEDYRDDLQRLDAQGHTIESTGPVTWGYRLEETPMSEAWRAITYEKGVWILHMLRQRLGTAQFLKMLAELRQRYEFKTVSTRDLQALAKEFLPPKSAPDSMDAFFDSWVYATGIPSLKLKSGQKGAAPAIRVTGTVEQKGVDSDFSVDVPVEIQFAKGPSEIVWVRTSEEGSPFSVTVKQPPTRVAILSHGGVLSVKN